jgi:hypothetical protein
MNWYDGLPQGLPPDTRRKLRRRRAVANVVVWIFLALPAFAGGFFVYTLILIVLDDDAWPLALAVSVPFTVFLWSVTEYRRIMREEAEKRAKEIDHRYRYYYCVDESDPRFAAR